MTKTLTLFLAALFIAASTGNVEVAKADEEIETWAEFRAELVETRQQLRAARSVIGQEWRYRECRFQSLRKGTWTDLEERLTAQCALAKWPATSWDTLDRIVECESHWWRGAYNPRGPYVGLAQHVLSSWDDRLRTYSPRGWDKTLRDRWQNSRSMLIVTVRMMAAQGLSPWSCA